MKRSRKEKGIEGKVSRSEEIGVVSSDEESPRRETEVDEDDEREALFGPEKDEGIRFEEPLQVPVPTDRPLDISPREESDGRGLGMVDQPDAATIAEYERGEEEIRRDRRSA